MREQALCNGRGTDGRSAVHQAQCVSRLRAHARSPRPTPHCAYRYWPLSVHPLGGRSRGAKARVPLRPGPRGVAANPLGCGAQTSFRSPITARRGSGERRCRALAETSHKPVKDWRLLPWKRAPNRSSMWSGREHDVSGRKTNSQCRSPTFGRTGRLRGVGGRPILSAEVFASSGYRVHPAVA
jgi:hypothetical protein